MKGGRQAMTLDQDLEDMLDKLWKKHPYPDKAFLDLKAKLLIVQELRKLQKCFSAKED
jgi:hypothetical protein